MSERQPRPNPVDNNPQKRTITVPDEGPQEECGLISFYAPKGMTGSEASQIFRAAEGIQHRGQQGAGISARTTSGESFIHTGFGLLPHALPDSVRNTVASLGTLRSATIQTRYTTDGSFQAENLQPIKIANLNGKSADVSHNGSFANTNASRERSGRSYSYPASDTRIWSDALPYQEGDTTDDMIVNAVQGTLGAASLVINVGSDTQYAARDPHGVRPLVLGRIEGELGPIWVVSSETRGLDLVDAAVERDIRPGEVVRFDNSGVTVLEKGDKGDERMCSLEMAYMSHPDSRVNVTSNGASPESWPSHGENRYEIGRQIAHEDKAREIAKRQKAERRREEYTEFKPDVVIGIPQSGIPFGQGYAEEMGIPYQQLIVKEPDNISRMFQADDNKNDRKAGILKKLQIQFPKDWEWEGKTVVLLDDSLVRGDASSTLSEVLTELGAEVHWRFGFPPIEHPCHLGVNIQTHDELIAHRNAGDKAKIAREIGAASVEFISNMGFVRSVQGDHFEPTGNLTNIFDVNRMCGGCITGQYPYPREEAA